MDRAQFIPFDPSNLYNVDLQGGPPPGMSRNSNQATRGSKQSIDNVPRTDVGSVSFSSDSTVEARDMSFAPMQYMPDTMNLSNFIPIPSNIAPAPDESKKKRVKSLVPNPAQPPPAAPISQQPVVGVHPPLSMISEFKFDVQGRGRGRGRSPNSEQPPNQPAKLGKGRAATQGTVINIPHAGRERALEELARKRQRFDDEEPVDTVDEEILRDLRTDRKAAEPANKRQKADGRPRRDHHACDRCFRNKTKVPSASEYVLCDSVIALSTASRLVINTLATTAPN
jgi:hypothetical protein